MQKRESRERRRALFEQGRRAQKGEKELETERKRVKVRDNERRVFKRH